MKNCLLGVVFLLGVLISPAFTQAAGLTTAQSTSLIAVVQSSPGTPASAFVNLITAFSNITVNQATSLIVVVQAAPNTPATAFVNLLTSFTDDTATTQPATLATNQEVTPTIPATPTPTQPSTTTTTSTSVAPTVILPPIDTALDIHSVTARNIHYDDWQSNHTIMPDGVYLYVVANEPLDFGKTQLSSGVFSTSTPPRLERMQNVSHNVITQTVYEYISKIEDASDTFDVTVQDLAGNQVTRTVTVQ